MPRLLPLYPFVLFGILDPLVLLITSLQSILSPQDFLVSLSRFSITSPPLDPSILVATVHLGMTYMALAGLTVIACHMTTDPKVIKGWLIVTGSVETIYMYGIYQGMGGWTGFKNVGAWSGSDWVNVVGGAFMGMNKMATLMEVFGKIGGTTKEGGKRE